MRTVEERGNRSMGKMRQWLAVVGGISCLMSADGGQSAHAGYAASPGNYLASVSDRYVCNALESKVSIENAETGDRIGEILLPAGAKPFGVVLVPNSTKGYVTDNASGKLYFFNNKILRKTLTTAGPLGPIAMDPKGRFAYATGSQGVVVVATSTNTILKTIPMDYAGSPVITPDGNRAYVSIDGNYGSLSQIKVINTSTHSVIKTIQLPLSTAPLGVAMHPTGRRLYVAGWVAGNVTVVDTDSKSATYHRVIATIPVSGSARGIAIHPSGSLCYVALDTGGVDCIVTTPSSAQYHAVAQHIPDAGPYGGLHEVAFTIDGRSAHVTVADHGRTHIVVIDSDPLSDTFNQVVRVDTTGEGPLGMAFASHM